MPRKKSPPTYRLHKARNCAVVTINGKNHYLGPHGSPESFEKYARLLAEWKSTQGITPLTDGCRPVGDPELTVAELVLAYWKFARTYYVKDGQPTGQLTVVKSALRFLRQLYGQSRAVDFGPLALQAVQQRMIEAGLSRSYINGHVRRIRLACKWATSQQLVPVTVFQALTTVTGLKKGRTPAYEPEPVAPVADEVVEATLPHLPVVVRDMVRVQRFVGCRPSEICTLRPCDVDRSQSVWLYRPASHKTEHLGRDRVILIGPRAQEILLPYLLRNATAYCFSPAESESKRKMLARANRKTKVQPSQANRAKHTPQRQPGERYTRYSYRTAVHRGCDKAFGEQHGPVSGVELMRLARQAAIGPRDMVRVGTRQRWRRARGLQGLFNPSTTPDEEINRPSAEGWYYKMAIPRWSPNQLRHSAATEIHSKFGLEAAQVVLGHSRANVTEIYAERDLAKAAEIAKQVG